MGLIFILFWYLVFFFLFDFFFVFVEVFLGFLVLVLYLFDEDVMVGFCILGCCVICEIFFLDEFVSMVLLVIFESW